MEDRTKELGKVDRVYFGGEDHGIWTISVQINFGGKVQSFGGVALDQWSEEDHRRIGTAAGLDLIIQLCRLFGVDQLEGLVGRPVYALRESPDWGALIVGLETPPFDGGKRLLLSEWQARWFRPSEEGGQHDAG
jgi:hypothetical protein